MLKPNHGLVLSFFLLHASTLFCFAEPATAQTDIYTVKDGDTLYHISMEVFTDEERARGAHWLNIYESSIEAGLMDQLRTPIFLGPSGLTVHIIPGQKLSIPRYKGIFPSTESVCSRYGVFTDGGVRVVGFVPAPAYVPVPATVTTTPPTDPSVSESSTGETSSAVPEKPTAIEIAPELEVAPVSGLASVTEFETEIEAEIVAQTETETETEIAPLIFEIPSLETVTPADDSGLFAEIATGMQASLPAGPARVEPAPDVQVPIAVVEAPPEKPVEPATVPDTTGFETREAKTVHNKSGWEVFTNPGASLYGDSTGFNIAIGIKSRLGDTGFPVQFLKNVTAGIAVLYDGVFLSDFPVTHAGADLLLGYRIAASDLFPGIPEWAHFRLSPTLAGGLIYQLIERNGREAYRGLAYHLAPIVGIDFPVAFDGCLRIGAEAGYHFYFSDLPLMNAHAGILLGWTF